MANPLQGNVKIPGLGEFPKAAVAIGVGGVVALIVIEKRRQSSASAPSTAPGTAAGDPYPPDGTTGNPSDPYSLDPGTGQTYGDEQASSGYAGGGGYGTPIQTAGNAYPWDGTYGNPSDPFSMDTGTGQTYGNEGGGGGGSSSGQPSGPPFSTNAQWSQYVLAYFSTNAYPDLGGRTDAIGLYLSGGAVTAQQATYIHDATAIGGTPPVAGPGNFPPSIRQKEPPTGGGTVNVPNVVGKNVAQAGQILAAHGLHASGPAAVKGIIHIVTKESPPAGSHVQKGTTVKLTVKDVKPPHKPAPKPPAKK